MQSIVAFHLCKPEFAVFPVNGLPLVGHKLTIAPAPSFVVYHLNVEAQPAVPL